MEVIKKGATMEELAIPALQAIPEPEEKDTKSEEEIPLKMINTTNRHLQQIEITKKIRSLEDVFLTSPFDNESLQKVIQNVNDIEFEDSIYPDAFTGWDTIVQKGLGKYIEPPGMIFLPTLSLFREMIRANVKFAKTDC